MLKFQYILLILILIIILIFFYPNFNDSDKERFNGGDNRNYLVLKNKPNPDIAAKNLAETNKFIIEFIDKLKKKYLYNNYTCLNEPQFNSSDEFIPYQDDCMNRGWKATGETLPMNDYRYRAIYLLVRRYRPNNLKENQPTSEHDTAWQEGKGDSIALCLREQATGKYNFVDSTILKFVAIHEISHTASDNLKHPPYFWKVFKLLLTEAKLLMGFDAPNYGLLPKDYCSLRVNHNPLYDYRINLNDQTIDLVEK